MNIQQSKKQRKETMQKIQTNKIDYAKRKELYENIESVKKYVTYMNYTPAERHRIWKAWEVFYKEVQFTPSYAMFQEQRKAFRENNMARVKDIGKQAGQMLRDPEYKWLTKPHPIEPESLYHDQSVIGYINLLEEIKHRQMSGLSF